MTSVGSAISQARAYQTQAEFNRRMSAINIAFAELQSADVIRRGAEKAQLQRLGARGVIGRQRASFAAQGISLEAGTPLEIQEETAAAGAINAMTVRNNAWREAWGYKVSALGLSGQGEMATLAARAQSTSTLLTGGLAAARDIASGYAGYARYSRGR
jgi:hypothetical protein